ncbi:MULTISPECIES: hypothetical protein [Microcystis]|uniref:Uncharacterized protein n=2 Tax=Microcystis TaxID=1125 RepID=I4HR47_MICAE|nr:MULTISPECIES: hypothetical protein [Microcystis]MBD2623675.1 hypothetical protein [Microcystis flos-aquae FACHB-1344]MCZ8046191.1 hypothetical protein [Microcystis sp. LE19-41.2A]CCI24521.1 hypothetical protein MICAH_3000009 [Microcystis aeruginosa PCC 9809]
MVGEDSVGSSQETVGSSQETPRQETGELRMSNNQLNGLFRDFMPVNLALPYLWS